MVGLYFDASQHQHGPGEGMLKCWRLFSIAGSNTFESCVWIKLGLFDARQISCAHAATFSMFNSRSTH